MKSVAIATRYYGQAPEHLVSFREWRAKAATTNLPIFVAVNVAADKTNALEELQDGDTVFPVTPWGKFVPALNALVAAAWNDGIRYLLFASCPAFPPTEHCVSELMQHMNDETLVVGARLTGHEYSPGETFLGNGVQIPWNTFAVWNLDLLRSTGFILQGDALFDPIQAGNEELVTASLIQLLHVSQGRSVPRVVLTKVAGVEEWSPAVIKEWDPDRREEHFNKLRTKCGRCLAQQTDMGLQMPLVTHL